TACVLGQGIHIHRAFSCSRADRSLLDFEFSSRKLASDLKSPRVNWSLSQKGASSAGFCQPPSTAPMTAWVGLKRVKFGMLLALEATALGIEEKKRASISDAL